MESDITTTRPPAIEYASPAPHETRDSNLAIASTIVPIVISPCVLVPVLGWLNLPHELLDRAMILLLTVSVALPIAAIVRIHLSRGTRTGLGWAACGLTVALLQVAIIAFLILVS